MGSSIFNSIPYVILYIILLFLYRNECNNRAQLRKTRSIETNAFVILLMFIGLRGHIYSDFYSYYKFFEFVPDITQVNNFEYLGMDRGFIFYTSIFKTIIPNYHFWVFFNTLIDLLVLTSFFRKYSPSVVLCFIFFIAYQGIYIEFNLYRNSKGLILFLLSIPYLVKNKFIPYFALNLLGATMHSSSVIYILLYPIINRRWNKNIIYLMIIVSSLFFILNIHFTSAVFEAVMGYSTELIINKLDKFSADEISYGLSLGFIERLLVVILILSKYKELVKQNEANIIFLNCLVIYYFILHFFADIAIFSERISYLFIFSFWVLLPQLFSLKIKYRRQIAIGLLMIGLFRLFTSNTNVLSYYDNLLWGIKSFDERSRIFLNTL